MNEDKVPFTFCLVRCSSSQYPFVPEIYLLPNVWLNWNQHSWSFWSLVISIPYRDIFLDAYKMSGPSRWAHLSGCKCTRIACPEEWIHWKGVIGAWDGSINCVKQPFYGNHLSSSSSISQVFPASFKDPTSEEALWQPAGCLQLAGTAPYNVQTPFLGLISKTSYLGKALRTRSKWVLNMSQLVFVSQ